MEATDRPLSPSDDVVSKDPLYGSTKRSLEFTTENHKVEVSGLPFKATYHVTKQMLDRQFNLKPHKIRVGRGKAYLAFNSEQERINAIEKIDNQDWKGRTLHAKIASPRSDPFLKRARNDNSDDANVEPNDDELVEDQDVDINSKICPLWTKTYEEQLKIKDNLMRSTLNIGKQLVALVPDLPQTAPGLSQWAKDNQPLCCKYDGVEPSPSITGYRNKCEFNIGSDSSVGFRAGRYKDGSERVILPPRSCPIINDTMFTIVESFQTFIKDSTKTKLSGFNHVTHEGNLRQLTLRTNQKCECLAIVDLHPQDLDKEALDKEIESFVDFFKPFDQVKSVIINLSDKNHLAKSEETFKVAYGDNYLTEYLEIDSGKALKFRIGPASFFQVNTKAAELLYRSIIDMAQLDAKSLVLDIGCGTGTISISLASKVSYVIGIEVVKTAVEDAKVNARDNGISNISFFSGRAEDLIGECIAILKGKLSEQKNEGEIVAIVDPPRTGFNSSFVKTIRASSIKKIIYIACDPKANANLVALCRPKSKAYQGQPFVPVRAKAFDLFPHTKFCELVLVYERLESETS